MALDSYLRKQKLITYLQDVDNMLDAACAVMRTEAQKEERRQGRVRSHMLYHEELER